MCALEMLDVRQTSKQFSYVLSLLFMSKSIEKWLYIELNCAYFVHIAYRKEYLLNYVNEWLGICTLHIIQRHTYFIYWAYVLFCRKTVQFLFYITDLEWTCSEA